MDMRRLQRLWYARLKATGFNDIEGGKDGTYVLLHCRPKGRDSVSSEAAEEFYRMAGWFLHEYAAWQSASEKLMWELFSSGTPYREIASQLDTSYRQVHKTLTRLIHGPFKKFQITLIEQGGLHGV